MASMGEAIYEDYLYKFTGRGRSIFGKSNPWKQKYFILKRLGNRPVLEYFNKKPKTRTAIPRGKVDLFPSYRVEKVTNMNNRAYVFQITTPGCTLRLSADEQRSMDVFVFFLQIQSHLKDQIREDFFYVKPENSEAQRRIGAKSVASLLHISPYGVTLALQSSRAVLAQWPFKSVRFYESSGRGELTLEAGRVAPMGDGLYVFHTAPGDDNRAYDAIDHYVMDTLDRAQPDRRGNTREIEDYVLEAERLLALTVVSACTCDNPAVPAIVHDNWNTDLSPQNSTRPKQVVHTRLTTSSSVASLNSLHSTSGPSLPPRATLDGSVRNSPQVPRSLPGIQNSPAAMARQGSSQSQSNLADRPPLPPPSTSIPMKVPQRSQTVDHPKPDTYLQMNSALNSALSRTHSSPTSPFTPPSADWQPPPSFRDVMQQGSRSPLAMYTPDSYLLPSPGAVATSTPIHQKNRASVRDQYLTPSSFSEQNNNSIIAGMHGDVNSKHTTKNQKNQLLDTKKSTNSPNKHRTRRLRSASCEDFSDYLRTVVYDPALMSKSLNDLLDFDEQETDDILPEPFPRLQTFSGRMEFEGDHYADNYYNIEGLKGKIYDGPGLTVGELRRRFTKRSQSKMRRSVSNPNFIGSLSAEKLHSVRVTAGYSSPHKARNRSFTNLIPDALKRRLSKDSGHQLSVGTLSAGSVSPRSGSHASSRCSSRAGSRSGSCSNSPYNSLHRNKGAHGKEDIVATTGVKGINVTKRSRSFRRHKAQDNENSISDLEKPIDNKDHLNNKTNTYQGNAREHGSQGADTEHSSQGADTEHSQEATGYIGFESPATKQSNLNVESKLKGDHSQSIASKHSKGGNFKTSVASNVEDVHSNTNLVKPRPAPKLAPKPAAKPPKTK